MSLFCTLVFLSACSTTPNTPASAQEMNRALMEVTGQNGRGCMRNHDISGYAALSDNVVSVSDKFRKHYLFVTSYSCPAIESSSAALFVGAFTEFCGGGRDSLATSQGRCPIRSVFSFENRQGAFDTYDKALDMIQAGRDRAPQ